MERRELLKMIALATGTVFIGGELLLSGCKNAPSLGGPSFTEDDISFLDEVAETILPRTSTPGAKDAGVGRFMTVMVNDCYTKEDQEIFHKGIAQLNDASNAEFKKDFMDASAEERTQLLNKLDKEAKDDQNKDKDGKNKYRYFTQMKQLVLFCFFTSKQGATEVLRHVAIPGKYDGAYPYKKGDRAWAE
jgi:hypothetical protein